MGKFIFTPTAIPEVQVVEPTVFGDDRGYFMETYQKDEFAAAGIDHEFVQDNQSRSTRGVLRGVHFQKEHTQGKLSAENKKMLYIPEGFAHGFLVLSDVAEFCYKCTDVYCPTAEGGIPYNDPTVNVQWPDCGCDYLLSAKDQKHEPFAEQSFDYFERW